MVAARRIESECNRFPAPPPGRWHPADAACPHLRREIPVPEFGSLPTYEELFGQPSTNGGQEARSVYSPAAYLADLLQLLDDRFEGAPLLESRQRIREIPLDAANTLSEIPYLDIVNEVLAGQVSAEPGKDAYTAMTALKAPFVMPFSLHDVRRRRYLQLAGIAPHRLYRRFATDADADVVT